MKIAIVGAGIGGMAAAHDLNRGNQQDNTAPGDSFRKAVRARQVRVQRYTGQKE